MPAPPPPIKKKRSVAPKVPPKAPPTPQQTRTIKKFEIVEWTGKGEGDKIVIYGPSGAGKTTLAALIARWVDPVFIGLDDGARKIKDPRTGKHLKHIPNVETFDDVRDTLHQKNLWQPGMACVLDTVTKLESISEPWLFENIKHEKGHFVTSLEGYGYGKGYKHSLDTMRLVLQDLDTLVRNGVHVLLLAQEAAVKIANSEGMDYIQDGPKLHHNNQHSTRLEVCEWADHVLRIGYHDMTVSVSTEADAKRGRGKVSGDAMRAIYTANALHFFAKSRTLTDPVVSFEAADDDTIWQLLFGELE